MLRPLEEEALRSVSAVSGNLARLSFLASLQKQPGVYEHWGLACEYGPEAVSSAFERTHRLVFETVLQTDVCELLGELRMRAEDAGETSSECLQRLLASPGINPVRSQQHIQDHFNYVFEALRALARHSE